MRAHTIAAALLVLGAATVHADDLPSLVRRLRDPSVQARWEAARGIVAFRGDIDSAKHALAAALSDDDVLVRQVAVKALARIGEAAVPWLVPSLHDADVEVRIDVARALGGLGVRAAGAVSALSQALRDPDVDVRGAAARALDAIGPPAASAIPALVAALSDADFAVRVAALRALVRVAEHASAEHARVATDAMLRITVDDPEAKALAQAAFSTFAEISFRRAHDALVKAEPSESRRAAARSLLRWSVRATLAALDDVAALPVAERREMDHAVRFVCARMGIAAERLIAKRIRMVPSASPREASVDSVVVGIDTLRGARAGSIGLIGMRALVAVCEASSEEDWCRWAVESPAALYEDAFPLIARVAVLGAIHEQRLGVPTVARWAHVAEPARDLLVAALRGPDPRSRADTLADLTIIGPRDRYLVPELLAIAEHHPWPSARRCAVRRIGNVGGADVPALERLRDTEADPMTRDAFAAACEALRGEASR